MKHYLFLALCLMLAGTASAQSIVALHPADEIVPPLLTARKAAVVWGEAKKAPASWTLLQCSDIHGSETNLSRIIAFRRAYQDYIDAAIHTGDAVICYYDDPNPWAQVEGADEVMNVIGNHDCWKGHKLWAESHRPYDATQGEAYLRFIEPYVKAWDVVQPQGVDMPASAHYQACYYYKDYPASSVRMVVLDCMHYEAAQHQWFQKILQDALHRQLEVVCVQHYPAQNGLDLIESGFTDLDESIEPVATPPGDTQMERMPDRAFQAVDAFLEEGGHFVCWLSGHTHLDFIGHVTGHPRQLQIIVDKAGELDDYMQEDRTPGSRNQDAFNLVTVNPSRHMLVIQRVGCNRDQYMRSKRLFSYDYRQQKILCNE